MLGVLGHYYDREKDHTDPLRFLVDSFQEYLGRKVSVWTHLGEGRAAPGIEQQKMQKVEQIGKVLRYEDEPTLSFCMLLWSLECFLVEC